MKEINNERLICPGIYQDGSSIRIDLSLYFSDSDAIPATVFAESVAGLNRMANQARDAIVALLGIDNPDKTALYLETVRNGSKFTDFIFRVFLGSDEDAARTADALHERFGVNRLMESKCIQNILIAAVIAYCIQGVVREFVPADLIILNISLKLGDEGNVNSSLESSALLFFILLCTYKLKIDLIKSMIFFCLYQASSGDKSSPVIKSSLVSIK